MKGRIHTVIVFTIVASLGRLTAQTPTAITAQQRLDRALQALRTATTDEQRFHALNDAAKQSFVLEKIDDASKYAHDLMALIPKFQGDWFYGNAIQDANLVLGRIAVREGRIDEAKELLLAAGGIPGSPTLISFGPNMSLARDLLEHGEREVVLEYFELCRRFWRYHGGRLDTWSQQVKSGYIPNFGANLIY